MLFGHQAIGGSEVADPRHAKFIQYGVTQLFVDSHGFYCSGDRCDPCIATGIFYEESYKEGLDEYDFKLETLYQVALRTSRDLGFTVFRDAL
jgi:hypothetical protein